MLSHGSSYNMDIFSSFKDFLRSRKITPQKIFELGKYCPFCTLYRAITSTYLTLSLKCKIFAISLLKKLAY